MVVILGLKLCKDSNMMSNNGSMWKRLIRKTIDVYKRQEHSCNIVRSGKQTEANQRKLCQHNRHQDKPQTLFPSQFGDQLDPHKLRNHISYDLGDRNNHLIIHIEELDILESLSLIHISDRRRHRLFEKGIPAERSQDGDQEITD